MYEAQASLLRGPVEDMNILSAMLEEWSSVATGAGEVEAATGATGISEDLCVECVEEFAAAGGCEDFGSDASRALIPAGCGDCDGEAEEFCSKNADEDEDDTEEEDTAGAEDIDEVKTDEVKTDEVKAEECGCPPAPCNQCTQTQKKNQALVVHASSSVSSHYASHASVQVAVAHNHENVTPEAVERWKKSYYGERV